MRLPVVPTIVIAQLFGTSLWFSANAAAAALMRDWGIGAAELGLLTNAVQLGFIIGTLTFALTGLADRFAASRIFAVCAVLGALANAAFALFAEGMSSGLVLRFAVGFSLAGVYPLGMKLIVSWVPERAGHALAQLVGMLTLGTALPHGVRFAGGDWPWQAVLLAASTLAVLAAIMIFALGDGPHLKRKPGAHPLRLGRVLTAFTIPTFRASAFGYFGHQWELYAMWTLVPLLIAGSSLAGFAASSALSFAVIGIGAVGCIAGGFVSRRAGSAPVAVFAMLVSALCCALFPFLSHAAPVVVLGLMLIWGASVVADSPHFSALSAKACPPEIVGSALALQNALGFAVTMVSIAWGTSVVEAWGAKVAWLLLPGPVLGVVAMLPLLRRPRD
ncbi:MFS transporter [Nitrogeniibacter aestuarii]|uniref:MFS transporter n=1 Tax=Nitrogeniibacter aestuarii TaxID=2815343 RepID=UPI001E5518FE|nr:MFS transporter [Nitrogeniibacter aestuarii]